MIRPTRWRRIRRSLGTVIGVSTLTAGVVVPANEVAAQNVNTAAIFLMQPAGARTVGHGEAAVADTLLGTEAMWWNAAGMARTRKREIGVHYGQGIFFSTTALLAATFPSKALGTIGAGYFLQSYEDTPALNGEGSQTGVNSSKYHVLSAAYATPIGNRFSAGLTAKYVMIRIICNGICDPAINPQSVGNAPAVDFGAQYSVAQFPIVFGASLRNIGSKLRTKDAPQADPLPRIVQFGARSRLPIEALKKSDASLDVMAEVLTSPVYSSPSFRFGADLSYKDTYTLRAGYKALSAIDGTERGLTAGVGLKYNSVQLDIARRFDESTANLGASTAPTFISLRFVF